MPKVEKSALVPVAAEKVFNVVNDVESYPGFVDGCSGARIIERSEHEMVAKLQISKAGYINEFTTKNELVEGKQIKLSLVDGPFDYLVGEWHFDALNENACRVNFSLDFKFKSKLMGLALNSLFQNLAESMMKAFIERAKQV